MEAAQVVAFVEMELSTRWFPAKLAPERAEMVEAARHTGCKPTAGLLLCLVELHRQIDIADLERAARVGAEDPDLAHPRQVAALAIHNALDKTSDPRRHL
jgi:hypothetical protein